ncbi:hypothetical protein [Alysiella crassa]|uniref:Uncharacterized protein n=1 Tax=Alysiella crassa TaxID=153491 RepID=A0A376BU52_9NEIS|nr:hypothetical protein [Alysiella crassa]UOP05898.1 hypothetical protein LVJ80_08385 [Alysiella crassa]SSY80323.1 Uncharacterised protein [Alysiella crassa]
MSLKEKFAAKKAKKENDWARKQSKTIITGKPRTGRTAHEIAAFRKMREMERERLQSGTPHSEAEIAEIAAENRFALAQIRNGENLIHAIGNYEKLARNMMVFAKLFESKRLLQICETAQTALKCQPIATMPLIELDEWTQVFMRELISKEAADIVSQYCTAVQMALYVIDYNKHGIKVLDAMKAIQKGASSRTLAKEFGQPETQFRKLILQAALDLYRVAECIVHLDPPTKIADLRTETWDKATDSQFLMEFLHKSKNLWLLPFEHRTGISIINHEKFVADILAIEYLNNHLTYSFSE